MSFDGNVSRAAATSEKTKDPSMGLRSIIQESIAFCVIAMTAAQIWTMVEVRRTVELHNEAVTRATSMAHANALVTQQALAHLEGREITGEAKGFQVPQRERPAIDLRSQIPE